MHITILASNSIEIRNGNFLLLPDNDTEVSPLVEDVAKKNCIPPGVYVDDAVIMSFIIFFKKRSKFEG